MSTENLDREIKANKFLNNNLRVRTCNGLRTKYEKDKGATQFGLDELLEQSCMRLVRQKAHGTGNISNIQRVHKLLLEWQSNVEAEEQI